MTIFQAMFCVLAFCAVLGTLYAAWIEIMATSFFGPEAFLAPATLPHALAAAGLDLVVVLIWLISRKRPQP
jgi:hypothetical protein